MWAQQEKIKKIIIFADKISPYDKTLKVRT